MRNENPKTFFAVHHHIRNENHFCGSPRVWDTVARLAHCTGIATERNMAQVAAVPYIF